MLSPNEIRTTPYQASIHKAYINHLTVTPFDKDTVQALFDTIPMDDFIDAVDSLPALPEASFVNLIHACIQNAESLPALTAVLALLEKTPLSSVVLAKFINPEPVLVRDDVDMYSALLHQSDWSLHKAIQNIIAANAQHIFLSMIDNSVFGPQCKMLVREVIWLNTLKENKQPECMVLSHSLFDDTISGSRKINIRKDKLRRAAELVDDELLFYAITLSSLDMVKTIFIEAHLNKTQKTPMDLLSLPVFKSNAHLLLKMTS